MIAATQAEPETFLFQIRTPEGLAVKISAIGATVCSIRLDGQELTLAYDDESAYATDPYYLGSTVGPYANRIRNASCWLEQQLVRLTANDGAHCLHGGAAGLNHLQWQLLTQEADQLTLGCRVEAGAGGFPGNREIRCHFRVSATELQIKFEATTDAPTILSLTNHCYFNLDPQQRQIDSHQLRCDLPVVLEKDAEGLPTGRLLRSAEQYPGLAAGQRLGPLLQQSGALDHCFAVSDHHNRLQAMATLISPDQQLSLTVLSDLPGLQIYSGDGLAAPFQARQGICLEAQYWPDAPNQPGFPATLLQPGQRYQQLIIYRFNRHTGADSND